MIFIELGSTKGSSHIPRAPKPPPKSNDCCPRCSGVLKADKNEKRCDKCCVYLIDGKWMRVCCDEYHRHGKDCLIEVKDLNG